MALTYQQMSTDEAVSLGLMAEDEKPYDYCNAIYRLEDGKYTLVGTDNGEPEDKSFDRRFDWVVTELNYAAQYYAKAKAEPPPAPTDEVQADIRKRLADFTARRAGATTPEARALNNAKINQLRKECKHPKIVALNGDKRCEDCGSIRE